MYNGLTVMSDFDTDMTPKQKKNIRYDKVCEIHEKYLKENIDPLLRIKRENFREMKIYYFNSLFATLFYNQNAASVFSKIIFANYNNQDLQNRVLNYFKDFIK